MCAVAHAGAWVGGARWPMPNEPKTEGRLLERLKRAAERGVTADELRRQRVSFVYGNLPEGSTLTRDQVASALARMEGESAA